MNTLAPYRIIDLSTGRADVAGLLLAGLGADVVSVEPPSGSSARTLGPFYKDQPDPEASLTHWAQNRGKRSVVLDLTSSADAARLRRLAEGADVLIEAHEPGAMAAVGLGYEELAARNPALIYVSVSPFGQDGPKSGWAATDLTVFAACGAMALTGDPDRAPLRISVPQIWVHAGAAAAGAALLGLFERNRSGRGQHVDVSAQQVAAIMTGAQVLAEPARAPLAIRAGGGINMGGISIRMVWQAKDGFVTITHAFGPLIGPFSRRLMEWVQEEGFCDEATRDKDWVQYGMFLSDGTESPDEYARVQKCIADFIASKSKAELFSGALTRRVLIAPVANAADVCEFEQFAARSHWEEVEHPELGRSLGYTGAWARLSATPLRPLPRAPRLGQHTKEVLDEPDRSPMIGEPDGEPPELPLSGINVLDFTWVAAGPFITRTLADHGATVVRVESSIRLDGARSLAPFLDNKPTAESSILFSDVNAGKLGITVDLGRQESRGTLEDLVRWADIVIESFSPRAMQSWGLGYEAIRTINPEVIMFSGSLLGQSGPYAQFAGFGNLSASLSGFYEVTGWPDRPPTGPFGAYTDLLSPHFGLTALLAALDHRRRTGEGQYIDFSQAEACLLGLQPELLNYMVNGHIGGRRGNDDVNFWPHGVYPTAETDGWVAVACATDEQWLDLCTVLGRRDLLADAALQDADGRRQQRDTIDAAIASWTAGRSADEATLVLQRAHVPAHAVQNSPECVADPQLRARGHFVEVDHPVIGRHTIEASRFRLSRTPGGPRRGAPTLNGDLQDVLSGLLGYDDDRIADLVALEIFQ